MNNLNGVKASAYFTRPCTPRNNAFDSATSNIESCAILVLFICEA